MTNGQDVLIELGYLGLTGLVGIVLLLFGIWLIDIATPGRLPTQLSRNMNASVVTSARLLAVSGIVLAAVTVDTGKGMPVSLLYVAAYGVAGIVVQTLATFVIGLAYRGSEHVVNFEGALKPLAVLLAAGQIASSLIVIASIL
jgi:hypothetical protein